ncbi:MAG TPA: 7TM diverse intracellular signaling domain-containing protein [Sphingobacteriaceae bacterium]
MKCKSAFLCIIMIVVLFLSGAAGVMAQNTDIASDELSISPFSYLEQQPGSGDIDRVKDQYTVGEFATVKENFMNFGRTENPYWIHFSVTAANKQPGLLLEVDNPHVYDVKLYRVTTSGNKLLYHTGSSFAFANRPVMTRNFVFPLDVDTGSTDYFLALDRKGEVLKFALNLSDHTTYQRRHNLNYWFYGGFAGILILIVIFNIFLRLTLDDPIHTWYTAYIVLILLFVLTDNGLGFEFLWNDYPGLNKHMRTFTGMLAFGVQLHFMQLFISQRSNNRLYLPVNITKYTFLILVILSVIPFAFNFNYSGQLAAIFYLVCSMAYLIGILLVALSLIEAIKQKNKTGVIYLVAVLPIMVQVLIVMLARWHVISPHVNTAFTMAVSILLEISILTFGLTIRYNYFKKQKDTLELALANQQKITMKKVLDTQEHEKRRIAEDLHDELGGTLASIKGLLSGLNSVQDQKQQHLLITSQHLLDKACEDLRFIAHDLMPAGFSKTSLVQALEDLVVKAGIASGIVFTFTSAGTPKDLDKNLELNVFRILNELIHNVRKHSGARNVMVQLTYHADFMQLMVEDDGCGFDINAQTDGIGLKNMQSRADYIQGKLYFDSGSQGTTIICNVPYPEYHTLCQ